MCSVYYGGYVIAHTGTMVSALVRGLMFVTVMLACTANNLLNDTADEGSALVTVIDDEDGELTQL